MQFEAQSVGRSPSPRRFVGLHPSALALGLARIALGYDISRYLRKPRDERYEREPLQVPSHYSLDRRSSDLRRPDLAPDVRRQTVVIAPSSSAAEQIADNLRFFLEDTSVEVSRFPSWDVLPFDAISPTAEIVAERLHTLHILLRGQPAIVVVSAETFLQKILPPTVFQKSCFELAIGNAVDRDFFVAALIDLGYLRSTVCEEVGQVAVRGSVVDVFTPSFTLPLRVELYEDRVESLRTFDPASQRSVEGGSLSSAEIVPASEFIMHSVDAASTLRDGRSRTQAEREAAGNVLRQRGLELDLPPRTLEGTVELLRQGGSWPGIEHLIPIFSQELTSLWSYFAPDATVVACDEISIVSALDGYEEIIRERAAQAETEERVFPEPSAAFFSAQPTLLLLQQKTAIFFDALSFVSLEDSSFRDLTESASSRALLETGERLALEPISELGQLLKRSRSSELPLKPLAEFIRGEQEQGLDVAIVISHPPKAKRLEELLSSYEIAVRREDSNFLNWTGSTAAQTLSKRGAPVSILVGYLTGGVRSVFDGITVITDREIFPEITSRKPGRTAAHVRRFLGTVAQLKENDFIVHIDHGLGIYRGLKQLVVEGKASDFLALEYADSAKLFVPVDNIGKVQKYVGADGTAPPLSKLGGKGWSTTKERVRQNIVELAGQLINLYAEREMVEGMSFGEVDDDDLRFSETFPFQETPDQEQAISAVLNDMAKSKPMDRLVCGDVGFGKTEVALRAAFKAANSGKQVAFLVPTTILADQHYATFQGRLREFKIRVGCVSRYYSTAENKKTLDNLAAGEIDVVIGTHRLLQRDVYFKNLGLLIVDEEHRFGVSDKEKLKRMRKEIDVLTLTATPIPRTLYMSLFDIRDLSVIETPPTDRQVIRTYLAPYQESIVREAIMRELGRQGQVFVIHNRVANIEAVTDQLKELVPEARVVFAHGQMKETELERVMHSFITHQADVLVSTTIVESGLDIPNANTIIVKDADKLGLAELYQLRGRVGRSSRRAYAYLLIADSKTLGADAKKRLQVLQSLDDLGMGFRLALQDMEIRGAGNLLGKDQSGKIELVGFDLYSRILKEAVREIRCRRGDLSAGNRTIALETLVDPEINIGFPIHIPAFYVPDVEERLLMYQRLVDIRDESEASELALELEDRFGTLPPDVVTLLEVMVFRGLLRRAGIVSAHYRRETLSIAFHREVQLPADRLLERIQNSRGRLKISPSMVLTIRIDQQVESPEVLTNETRDVLRSIGMDLS